DTQTPAEGFVRKGLSFRESHKLVGTIVRESSGKGRMLGELTPEEVSRFSRETIGKELKVTAEELKRALDPAVSLRLRQTSGSPNPDEVERMIQERRRRLGDSRAELKTEVQRLEKTLDELLEIVRSTTRVDR
ncbi:hypothetical protein KEJ39_09585, partial [Candidatus Bathyarchaeota archaeon]|nr:hypothetical protein [Candidatus Bathyarchaeota archaeon]